MASSEGLRALPPQCLVDYLFERMYAQLNWTFDDEENDNKAFVRQMKLDDTLMTIATHLHDLITSETHEAVITRCLHMLGSSVLQERRVAETLCSLVLCDEDQRLNLTYEQLLRCESLQKTKASLVDCLCACVKVETCHTRLTTLLRMLAENCSEASEEKRNAMAKALVDFCTRGVTFASFAASASNNISLLDALLVLDEVLDDYKAQEDEATVTFDDVTISRRLLDACCILIAKTALSSKARSEHFDVILNKIVLPALSISYEKTPCTRLQLAQLLCNQAQSTAIKKAIETMLAEAYETPTVSLVALETLRIARTDEERRIAHEILRGVHKRQSGDREKWKETLKNVIDNSPYCSWRLQLRDANDVTLKQWLQALDDEYAIQHGDRIEAKTESKTQSPKTKCGSERKAGSDDALEAVRLALIRHEVPVAHTFLIMIAKLKGASGNEDGVLSTLRTIENGLNTVQNESNVHAPRLLMLINALSQCTSVNVHVTKLVESCLSKACALVASGHLSQPIQRELVEKQLQKNVSHTSVEPGELADDVEMVEEKMSAPVVSVEEKGKEGEDRAECVIETYPKPTTNERMLAAFMAHFVRALYKPAQRETRVEEALAHTAAIASLAIRYPQAFVNRAPAWTSQVRDSIMSSADAGAETAAPCAHVIACFTERVLQQRPVAEALFHDKRRANAVMTLLLDFVQVTCVRYQRHASVIIPPVAKLMLLRYEISPISCVQHAQEYWALLVFLRQKYPALKTLTVLLERIPQPSGAPTLSTSMHELLLMLVGAQEDKNLSTPNSRVRSPPPTDRQKTSILHSRFALPHEDCASLLHDTATHLRAAPTAARELIGSILRFVDMSPAQCGIESALSEALLAALLSDGAAEIATHVARRLLRVAWPHLPLTSEQLNALVVRLLPLLDEELRAKLLRYTVNYLIHDGIALANVEKCYRPLIKAVQPMDE